MQNKNIIVYDIEENAIDIQLRLIQKKCDG